MINSFLLLCLTLCYENEIAKTQINLTDIEVYEPGSLALYKIEEHYLLSSAIPTEKLQVVNQKGELLFEYKAEGKGPGELHYHSILTITESEIYIHSKGAGVLIFDHQLNLLSKSEDTKRLQSEFAMARPFGTLERENAFFIFGHEFLGFHLYTFSIHDAFGKGVWEPRRSELKKYGEHHSVKNPEISFVHRDTVFTRSVKIFIDQDEYRVFAHQRHNNQWQIVAELVGSVDELGVWFGNLKGAVNQTLRTDTGYLVEISGANPSSKSHGDITNYYDFYDEDGQFQRRVVKFNHQLFAVAGSAEILELVREGDDDILRTIDVSKLKP